MYRAPRQHMATESPEPLTSALQRAPESPVRMESLVKESKVEELDLPSTPDTFQAARDLIAMTPQQSPVSVERVLHLRPLALQVAVLARGKPAMMWRQSPLPQRRSPSSWHRSPAPQQRSPHPSTSRLCLDAGHPHLGTGRLHLNTILCSHLAR